MKRLIFCLGLSITAFSAMAQSRSSFIDVSSLNDITVSGSGLDFDVSVGATPSFEVGGVTYDVLSVIGFWALSNDDDLAATGATFGGGGFGGANNWDWGVNNAGTGGIAGWKINWAGGANGVDPNTTQAFHYDSLAESSVEQYGFKVVVDGLFPGTTGNTGFITVPEPTTLAGMAVAVAALMFRRRKR